MRSRMPNAMLITTAGTNCDTELAVAFERAGAAVESVHLNRLLAKPALLERADLIGLPGGFSYGDAVAAGRIAANLMRQHLWEALTGAVERGVAIIAPCNGFQVAVQVGLLPGPDAGEPWPDSPPTPVASLGVNDSACFVDRWCRVEVDADSHCVWTRDLPSDPQVALLPVAHGEGRFVPGSDDLIARLEAGGRIPVRYANDDNPNGSVANIAGICDASGLVFGLMPHPERYTSWTQHPFRTRLQPQVTANSEPFGLQMFRNAVKHAAAVVA